MQEAWHTFIVKLSGIKSGNNIINKVKQVKTNGDERYRKSKAYLPKQPCLQIVK